MAKTPETIKQEKLIWDATVENRMDTFGCFEVTIGIHGKERVDYLTVDTKGIWRAYEIKVSKPDFHSKHANSWVGHYNYYVMPLHLYEQVKHEIPPDIGVYCDGSCIKQAKYHDINSSCAMAIKYMNGKPVTVEVPQTDLLKDSMIRSLARGNSKLMKLRNKDVLDKYRCTISHLQDSMRYGQRIHGELIRKLSTLLGRSVVRVILDADPDNLPETLKTNREFLISQPKDSLARTLLQLRSNPDLNSIAAMERWLNKPYGESIPSNKD